jgi:uncharacterized protein
MFNLMPRVDVFFSLFEQSANNVHEGTKRLRDLLTDYTDVTAKLQAIKDLEHANDHVTHELLDHLNKTFITPLDREDIHALASRLDDVLDLVDAASQRLFLYKVDGIPDDAQALAEVLVAATATLKDAVGFLRNLSKSRDKILRACIDVNTYENQGDRLFHHALAQLFETSTSAVDIIKWKDIYYLLEENTDMCEDVANVIEAIVMKNS